MIERVYIYRIVDLEFGACRDFVFRTKQEAMDNLKQYNRGKDEEDLIISVILFDTDYSFRKISEMLERTNVFEKTLDFVFDCKIIYRR